MAMSLGVLSLGWRAGRTLVARCLAMCSHWRKKKKENQNPSGDGESEGRSGGVHPFSHVFDMEVFPTGVKKGRADWAE